jgi:glycerophosphoryl diester phosphodiesterase
MVKTLDELGDDPEDWGRLREKGVDAILTDYPRLLRQRLCPECRE